MNELVSSLVCVLGHHNIPPKWCIELSLRLFSELICLKVVQ